MPHLLRALRKERNLSQRGLAKLSRVPQPFISRLERGETRGSPRTLGALCTALDVDLGDVTKRLQWGTEGPGRRDRSTARRVENAFSPSHVYAYVGPSSLAERVAVLRNRPGGVLRLHEAAIDARADSHEISCFLGEFGTDSGDEVLLLLGLAGAGGKAAMLAPARLGSGLLDLREKKSRPYLGNRLMRTLVLQSGAWILVFFVQVPILAGWPRRVDFLVALKSPHGTDWQVIEVDGDGHDDSYDEERSQALRLPVLRLLPAGLEDPAHIREILRTLARRHLETVQPLCRALAGPEW